MTRVSDLLRLLLRVGAVQTATWLLDWAASAPHGVQDRAPPHASGHAQGGGADIAQPEQSAVVAATAPKGLPPKAKLKKPTPSRRHAAPDRRSPLGESAICHQSAWLLMTVPPSGLGARAVAEALILKNVVAPADESALIRAVSRVLSRYAKKDRPGGQWFIGHGSGKHRTYTVTPFGREQFVKDEHGDGA